MMKPAKKTSGKPMFPMFRNLLDDFWGNERFFDDDWFRMPNIKMPAVNIKENDGNFEIEVAAPGLGKDDFNVSVENGILTISAEKEEKKEEKEEGFTRREFNYNHFTRSFSVPENVDAEKINARYEDGVLKLNLKKLEVSKPKAKAIPIQ